MVPLPPDPAALGAKIVEIARRLGFHRVGLGPVEPAARHDAYLAWLAAGYHGEMTYLATPESQAARRDVRTLFPQARTVVAVALAYARGGPRLPVVDQGSLARVPLASLTPLGTASQGPGPRGVIARYALGQDYHQVLKDKLGTLDSELQAHGIQARSMVDLLPVLERDEAERLGLGFVGKNCLLIAPGTGSYVVLGELLVDAEATLAPAHERKRCGSCRACLDVCPTGAFVDAFVLDARRCISYLTIENPGPIPRELRPLMGLHVFGCDLCQEVCPWNATDGAPPAPELSPRSPARGAPELIPLLDLGANQYRQLVKHSALRRVHKHQLRRNVCVALGNAGDPAAIPALTRALAGDSALVRTHAGWALGRLGAHDALEARRPLESDALVLAEIDASLAEA
jgi:epoxyqueuosine reductase